MTITPPRRRLLLLATAATLLPVPIRAQAPASAAASMPARPTLAGLPSIAVLPVDFIDDHENPDTVEAQKRRLLAARVQLQRELTERGLYRVVDPTPAAPLVASLLETQTFLYRCQDCAVQVGQKLGTDLVLASWVQKVSELILNFNVELFRTADGHSLLSKSVDMRGNRDDSWERSVRYLVRDMAERREANPAYGR